MMPASTAAPPPTSIEPRLVEKRFWAISTTSSSSLFGHHDDAGVDAAWITRFGPISADLVEIEDEVPHDEAVVGFAFRTLRSPSGNPYVPSPAGSSGLNIHQLLCPLVPSSSHEVAFSSR